MKKPATNKLVKVSTKVNVLKAKFENGAWFSWDNHLLQIKVLAWREFTAAEKADEAKRFPHIAAMM